MNLILFDQPLIRDNLKPFTLTRPVAEIRCGIHTLGEKWQRALSDTLNIQQTSYLTEKYLSQKYPMLVEEENLLINAACFPDKLLVEKILDLQLYEVLKHDSHTIAMRTDRDLLKQIAKEDSYEAGFEKLRHAGSNYTSKDYNTPVQGITQLWDIFLQNGEQISADFEQLIKGRTSQEITDPHTIFYGEKKDLFIEEGASIKASILNAETGPIYIGRNATVHENAVIKGPFALLGHSHVNIGSKIREATTIGPYSKLGGEVKNVVVFGNSNKGHEGFLGNAVVGEWCNFGADTNASNLKNNYKTVKVWNYGTNSLEDSGEMFVGLMMGDHSKCGINTMFNTGTVVGVCTNIFGIDYPDKFIPSFTWGGTTESNLYQLDKALEVVDNVMQRRGLKLSEAESAILRYIFDHRSQEVGNPS